MALQALYLIQTACQGDYRYSGSLEAYIYEIRLWDPFVSVSGDNGILYLADSLEDSRADNSSVNILYLPKTSLLKCNQEMNRLIAQDYRRNVAFIDLCNGLSVNLSISRLVSIAHSIMQNPVWLTDCNFQIIAHSVPGRQKVLFPQILQQRAKQLDGYPTIINKNENFPTRHILAPINIDNLTTGYILVFEEENDFKEREDLEFASQTGTLMGKYLNSNSLIFHSSPIEQFILNILQKNSDSETIQQQMLNLQFEEHEKYYLLVIDQGPTHSSIYIKNELRKILKLDVYEFNHYYIVLLGCFSTDILSEQDFPELVDFLKKHSMYSGLSNAFFQLSALPQTYEQGKNAIRLRKRFSDNTYFARYEDLILIHLLDIANENGISVLSFCHPSTILIWEYDREHGSEYLKTLSAYVFNYCNLQQTADTLFIHRNTVYHRINMIKDLFNIDFDNSRLFMKLRISATVFNYLNIVSGINTLGPIK